MHDPKMILGTLTHRLGRNTSNTKASTTNSSVNKLLFIDALRGLAALYVIICHVKFLPTPNLRATQITTNLVLAGHTGVILFFIISAFTLCLSFKKRKASLARDQTRDFYLRRFFRILPLYVFTVFLSWIRDLNLYGYARPWMDSLGASMSIFQPGNYTGLVWASWTLSIELTFYLLFPFIFKLCSTFKRSCILLLLSIFADLAYVEFVTAGLSDPLRSPISTNAHAISTLIEDQIRFGFLHNFQFFILGIVFFHIYRKIDPLPSKLPRILTIFTGVAGFFALVVFYPASIYSIWHGRHSLLAVFLMVFVVGVSWYPTRLLVNRLTIFLGTISYSLYLLHPSLVAFLSPLYAKLYKLNWHPDLSYALCLIATLIILVPLSIMTYKLIEVPGIKLGSKIIRSMSP